MMEARDLTRTSIIFSLHVDNIKAKNLKFKNLDDEFQMIGNHHRQIFCTVTLMVVHLFLDVDQRAWLAKFNNIFMSTTKRTIEAAVAFENASIDHSGFYVSPEVVVFRSEWLGSNLMP
jgi:hypothetical protein